MKDYAYIQAWGRMLRSFPYYVKGEVEKARRDGAPETAIYRREDGTWAVFEEISCENTKRAMSAILKDMEQQDGATDAHT